MDWYKTAVDAMLKQGGPAAWAWIALMGLTWLLFYYGSDRPLSHNALIGAGVTYAVILIVVSAVSKAIRQRRGKSQAPTAPEDVEPTE